MPIRIAADKEALTRCFSLITTDKRNQLPIQHPNEVEIVRANLDEFISELANDLHNGLYRPATALVADLPKGNGALRPIHVLRLKDQVVYAYLGLQCLEAIVRDLGPEHRYMDYSYRIRTPIDPKQWFTPYFIPWSEFGAASLKQLDDGATVMVETDIAAFYENIDQGLLRSELRRLRIDDSVINLLKAGLAVWSFQGRGLPQGCPTSHLLAKFYLSSIDTQLKARGIIAKRFVDDVRLFCRSLPDSKRALQELIREMRVRTLNTQTAKTRFLSAEEARKSVLGFRPIVDQIHREYEAAEIRSLESEFQESEYMSVHEIIRERRESDTIPLEVIWRAYDEHIKGRFSGDDGFNKSAFHFLLGRLGKARDNYAVDDCLERFVVQPQETTNILDYFRAIALSAEQESRLCDFIEHDDNVYDFQTYEMLRFLSEATIHDVGRVQGIARRFAFSQTSEPYVRSWARHLLGKYGLHSDLEAMQASYPTARDEVEQAEIICGIARMEPARRNAFYSNFKEGPLVVRGAINQSRTVQH